MKIPQVDISKISLLSDKPEKEDFQGKLSLFFGNNNNHRSAWTRRKKSSSLLAFFRRAVPLPNSKVKDGKLGMQMGWLGSFTHYLIPYVCFVWNSKIP